MYTPEFKLEVAKKIHDYPSIAAMDRELEVDAGAIRVWKKGYQEHGEAYFHKSGKELKEKEKEKEIQDLKDALREERKENKELRQANFSRKSHLLFIYFLGYSPKITFYVSSGRKFPYLLL